MNSSGIPPVSRNRNLQRRLLVDAEGELKPLWPTSSTFTSTSASASITDARRGDGNDRADHQA